MTRYIYSNAASREIPDLLQSILIAELIRPSKQLFVASPWVSDISVIRNRSNEFMILNPEWAHKDITFSDVLADLIKRGTKVYIETRKLPHNGRFLDTLLQKCGKDHAPADISYSPILHRKGLLGDHFFLSGSMNFTFNGITMLDEFVQYTTQESAISENRIVWERTWGRGGK